MDVVVKTRRLIQAINESNLSEIKHLLSLSSADFLNRLLDTSVSVYQTFLGQAVQLGNIDIIELLLQSGANPNGKTESGYPLRVPISLIRMDVRTFKPILDLLLLSKANINWSGLNGIGLLSSIVSAPKFNSHIISKDDSLILYNLLYYALSKGANPNIRGTNPLDRVLNDLRFKSKLIRKRIIHLLLYFGANPYLQLYNDSIYVSQSDKFVYEPLSKLIFSKDKGCYSSILLKKIAKAMKIPTENINLDRKSDRDKLCKCVKYIKEHADEIDYDNIVKMRKKKLNRTCNNEYTIMGDVFDEFSEEEVITLKERNLVWCFHVSEIPNLLESQINPYSHNPLPIEFLEDILEHSEYFELITLQEAIQLLDKKPEKDKEDILNVYINELDDLLKGANPYFNGASIKTLQASGLMDIIDRLKNYIYIDTYYLYNKGMLSYKDYHRKLLKTVLMNIKTSLHRANISSLQLIEELNKIITEYSIIKGWEKILGKPELLRLIPDLVNHIDFVTVEPLVGEENYNKMSDILISGLENIRLVTERWQDLRGTLSRYERDTRDGNNG